MCKVRPWWSWSIPDLAKILVANVAELILETWAHSGAKWGNNSRIKIYHRLFGVWENLRIALSSAYEMSPKNTIFSIWEEVGLTNKAADRSMNSSLSSKQTIVGWPTAGSCHPILVFRNDFSSNAEIHDDNYWLALNRIYEYLGFIDLLGNPELGRWLGGSSKTHNRSSTVVTPFLLFHFWSSVFSMINYSVVAVRLNY